jgi:hypothetical protein
MLAARACAAPRTRLSQPQRGFVWLENHYKRLLGWTLDHRGTTAASR